MKYFATKNQNKKEEKQPDFILYMKDGEGEIITEEYTNKQGETKTSWKKFGAMWFNLDGSKIKSANIVIDNKEEKKNVIKESNPF